MYIIITLSSENSIYIYIILWVRTLDYFDFFVGSILSLHQYKNHKFYRLWPLTRGWQIETGRKIIALVLHWSVIYVGLIVLTLLFK